MTPLEDWKSYPHSTMSNHNDSKSEIPTILSEEELQHIKKCLPKAPSMANNKIQLINYQGSWFPETFLPGTIKFRRHFLARDSDLVITGLPKTGTTWLKSLLFATVNRGNNPINQNPLLRNHPQELVYNLESDIYGEAFAYPRPQHLDELPSPRLLSTHLSYTSLPDSIRDSKCRFLYICRNPLDTLVSLFHFEVSSIKKKGNVGSDREAPRFEDCFEDFCEGKYQRGPFFEHVVAYWKMSLEQPDKVLFLKYEDLKDDAEHHLKRIARFVGVPFSPKEEGEGVIRQIVELCSIGSMKELEVNKQGNINNLFEKKTYFRKGEVGDWTNHFTPTMVEKITKIMEEKLHGTGLSFKLLP